MEIRIRFKDDQNQTQNFRFSFDADDVLRMAVRNGYKPKIVDPALIDQRTAKITELDTLDPATPEHEVALSELKVIERNMRRKIDNPKSAEPFAADFVEDWLARFMVDNNEVQDEAERAREAAEKTRRDAAKAKMRQP